MASTRRALLAAPDRRRHRPKNTPKKSGRRGAAPEGIAPKGPPEAFDGRGAAPTVKAPSARGGDGARQLRHQQSRQLGVREGARGSSRDGDLEFRPPNSPKSDPDDLRNWTPPPKSTPRILENGPHSTRTLDTVSAVWSVPKGVSRKKTCSKKCDIFDQK